MLFDTHAHINDSRFDDDREDILNSLKDKNVGAYVEIGTDIESSYKAIELAEKYDFIYAAVGMYPHDTENMTDADLAELKNMCKHEKVVAIGEIGLDYYWDGTPKDVQKHWFKKQLELASELNMPVVIHSRDAMGDTIDILKNTQNCGGIIHCYSGSAESAKILLNLGFYISFAGPLTFKNAKNLCEAALVVPDDRLLIETDSPYLSPEPYRGKRNYPANVGEVAKKLAELKNTTYEYIQEITYENALKVYNIKNRG